MNSNHVEDSTFLGVRRRSSCVVLRSLWCEPGSLLVWHDGLCSSAPGVSHVVEVFRALAITLNCGHLLTELADTTTLSSGQGEVASPLTVSHVPSVVFSRALFLGSHDFQSSPVSDHSQCRSCRHGVRSKLEDRCSDTTWRAAHAGGLKQTCRTDGVESSISPCLHQRPHWQRPQCREFHLTTSGADSPAAPSQTKLSS